ncbi:CWC15 [Candida jiufengensis]|uniref:CWC15 n=1 Tax=Candida jiufengensis TaxID=497108 RepID=UPI00222455D5|nr:CWC15 [Candida jiufengensis]KAI5954334.1 CWC15 [Candida jiufengensis]
MTTNHRPTLISKKGKNIKIRDSIKHARSFPQQPGLKFRKNLQGIPIEILNNAVNELKAEQDKSKSEDNDDKKVDDVVAKFMANKKINDQKNIQSRILPPAKIITNEVLDNGEDKTKSNNNENEYDNNNDNNDKTDNDNNDEILPNNEDSNIAKPSRRLIEYDSSSSEEEEEEEEEDKDEESSKEKNKNLIEVVDLEAVEDTINKEEESHSVNESKTTISNSNAKNDEAISEESTSEEDDEEETAELLAELNRLKQLKSQNQQQRHQQQQPNQKPLLDNVLSDLQTATTKKKNWRSSPLKTNKVTNARQVVTDSNSNQKFLSEYIK